MLKKRNHRLFLLSAAISVLLLAVSVAGFTSPELYGRENPSWRAQCAGQDLINLAIVAPSLMLISLLLTQERPIAYLVWPGIMIYLVYTFAIYCFSVHFNAYFLEYCIIFGLSVYGLGYFIVTGADQWKDSFTTHLWLSRAIAVYFLLTGLVFYSLWLSEILQAIRTGSAPRSTAEAGLATNPVHVLDISVILPLFLITSVLLFRKRQAGLQLAAFLLGFSALMDITIFTLNILTKPDPFVTVAFAVLAALSVLLLAGLKFKFRTWPNDTVSA